MLIIFNVWSYIGDNTGNGILQSWIRIRYQELSLIPTQSQLHLSVAALMVPLGMFSPPLLFLFRLFGFIVTFALIYIYFAIAQMIINCHNEAILLSVVTNNTVIRQNKCTPTTSAPLSYLSIDDTLFWRGLSTDACSEIF